MRVAERDRATRPGTVFVIGTRSGSVDALADAARKAGLAVVEPDPGRDQSWDAVQTAEIVVALVDSTSTDSLVLVGAAAVLGKKLLLVATDAAEVPTDLAGLPVVRAEGRRLSSRVAQELARLRDLPILERTTVPLPAGDRVDEVVDVEVVQVQPGVAVVRTVDGREALLLAEDLSWTRKIRDLRRVLRLGQPLHGALIGADDEQARFSVRAVEEDPWPALENLAGTGEPVEGTVFSWQPRIGLFVDLGHGVNGLVPRSTLSDDARFESGGPVTVEVARVDRDAKEAELRLVSTLPVPLLPPFPYEVGEETVATVTHVQPGRGFVLVALPDGFSAILPFRRMSTVASAALATGALKPGDTFPVRIVNVDAARRRVEVADEMPARPTPAQGRRVRSRRGADASEELGRRIKMSRKALAWSQEELGERSGFHRTFVGHLERGEINPTLHSVIKIAVALGVDAGDLVRGLEP